MTIELTIGPLLFHWQQQRIEDFYAAIADEADVARVYLGEVVCAKRIPRQEAALLKSADRLRRAGKEIVWASLALPTDVRDRQIVIASAARPDLIEANDIAALAGRSADAPFVAGPLLNVYNEGAARAMRQRGCVRVCANIELSMNAIRALHTGCPDLEIEVFAFGRVPLSLSARCYHARVHCLHRDGCQFVCQKDPDGLDTGTLDDQPFLVINGVQTLSHDYHCLDTPPHRLEASGVRALRLSPHTGDMISLIRAYRRFLDGDGDSASLRQAATAAAGGAGLINGYAHGRQGLAWIEAP